MASSGRIERRDTHQPVYTFFSLQVTVSVEALDQQRDTLDARFVARQIIEHLNLEAVLFGPAGIHAQQHLSPVLGLRSARTRMQLQNGIELVIRLIKQQLKLKIIDFACYSADSSGNLCRKLFIAFFISQLRHHCCIIILLLQLLKMVHGGFHRIHFANDTLCLLGIIPEAGRSHLLFKVCNHLELQV
ncbi:hypothetical protein D3C75_949780 [compost metagenome]